MHRFNKYISKLKLYACLMLIVFSALTPLKVFAYDEGFFAANDILFYNPDDCVSEGGTTTGVDSSGPVVAIGDSILQSAEGGGLKKNLNDKGYSDVTIDAVQSRHLASPGVGTTTGIQAIEITNKNKIASAGTVLIVLGTNYDGDFESNLKTAINTIKSINSDVRIFWTNVGIKTQISYMNKTNSILGRLKTSQGYTLIDWHKAVTDNPGYIGSDNVHPNANGAKKLSELIASSLGAAGSSGNGAGASSGGAAPVKGTKQEKNAAQVWNYLTGKGLSAEQAAGFLGNMQAESGIRPDINEYSGGGGYGLIQWTGVRRTSLESFANSKSKPASDLGLQLDFLWHELTTSYQSSVLDPLKKTGSVRAAAVVILTEFEKPADQSEGVQDDRTGFAEKWFKFFKGYASDGSTDGCQDQGGNGNGSSAGVNGWERKGPNAMTYYAQCDPKWAASPYGSSTICPSGCGLTSITMVIATLTNNKSITPDKMGKKYSSFYVPGAGTNHGLFPKAASDYGFKYKDLGGDFDAVREILKGGGLVIVGANAGFFTSGGHLMVIRAMTDDGSKFYFANPSRPTEEGPFTPEFIKTQGNMGGLWGFYK